MTQQRLCKGPKNDVYTSSDIQNTILYIMGEMVANKISSEVTLVFSGLADEDKDCSKFEKW